MVEKTLKVQFFSPLALRKLDGIVILLFLYFFTLHADALSIALGGFTIRVNNLLAFLLAFLALLRFRTRLFHLPRSLVYSLAFLGVSILLSLALSPYKTRCAVFFTWFAFIALCYVILPYFLAQVLDANRLFSLYLASFVLVGVYAACQFVFSCFGLQDPFAPQLIKGYWVRPNGFAYEPSYYALYMAPFISLVNFHYLTSPQTPFFCFRRLSLPLTFCLNLLFLVSTSTSAFLFYPLFFVCLLFTPIVSKKRLLQFVLGFSGLALVAFFCLPFLMRTFFLKFFYGGLMAHNSFTARWEGIVQAWKVFTEHPLFGVGLGGYSSHLKEGWLSGRTQFSDAYVINFLLEGKRIDKFFEASNVLTEVLASLGLMGLFAFTLLLTSFFSLAKKAYSRAPTLTLNLVISILCMLGMMQINQGLLRTYTYAHFALCYALIHKLSIEDPLSRWSAPSKSDF